MKDITGTLISLSKIISPYQYTASGNIYNLYPVYSATEIDSVCQALKNLLTENVNSLTVASSATNAYILTHTGMETGYALRIIGAATVTTTGAKMYPYVQIEEGIWNGSSFVTKFYYRILPFITNLANVSNDGYCGNVTYNWSYKYRLIVDDSETSFALALSVDDIDSAFTYSDASLTNGVFVQYNTSTQNENNNQFRFAYCTYSGRNYYQSVSWTSKSKTIIGLLPISGVYRLTIFEPRNCPSDSLGSSLLAFGSQSSKHFVLAQPKRFGADADPNNIFYGWTIYNRKYVIASTMYPQSQETDYGEIKMVKLGVHEYGLPYIIDGLYVDNFFACERNSNLVNNQIIEIDGYKYLYCDSGYLFKLGAVPVRLETPTVSLNEDTLTISAVEHATGYKVYSNGTLLTTATTTTVNLAALITASGTYSITVRATGGAGYLDSEPSIAVSYTPAEYAEQDGDEVTLNGAYSATQSGARLTIE